MESVGSYPYHWNQLHVQLYCYSLAPSVLVNLTSKRYDERFILPNLKCKEVRIICKQGGTMCVRGNAPDKNSH
jgi:hypothetical protein